MYNAERYDKILEILRFQATISVNELSELFHISEVTIRKDLKYLESCGKLQRTHGGAVRKRTTLTKLPIDSRKILREDEKKAIAKVAISKIYPLNTIFLDSSSINVLLAERIRELDFSVTIVTNMLEIALILKGSHHKLILIGGEYDSQLGALISSFASLEIERYNYDAVFLGAAGINLERGTLSNFSESEATLKKRMLLSSKLKILLCESHKFTQDGSVNFATLSDISVLICDKHIDEQTVTILKEKTIEVILA